MNVKTLAMNEITKPNITLNFIDFNGIDYSQATALAKEFHMFL
jgi:hypothetical protein